MMIDDVAMRGLIGTSNALASDSLVDSLNGFQLDSPHKPGHKAIKKDSKKSSQTYQMTYRLKKKQLDHLFVKIADLGNEMKV